MILFGKLQMRDMPSPISLDTKCNPMLKDQYKHIEIPTDQFCFGAKASCSLSLNVQNSQASIEPEYFRKVCDD